MKKRFHKIDNEKPKTVNSFAQTNARNIFEPQTDIMKSEEHSALEERYEDLEKEYEEEKKARRRDQRRIRSLEAQVKRLQTKVKNPSQKILKNSMDTLLKKRHVPKSQIAVLISGKKWTWNKNDPEGLARAAVQFSISSNLYEHNRRLMGNLYLPDRKTLAKHFSHFQVTPGFQFDAIRILEKMKQLSKKKHYEHALIAFDEVALNGSEVEMDKRTQTVYGPNSKLQVVSIRGLGPR